MVATRVAIAICLCIATSFVACGDLSKKHLDPSSGTTTLPGPTGYGFDPNQLLADFVVPPGLAMSTIQISTLPGERAFPASVEGHDIVIFVIDQAQHSALQGFCSGTDPETTIIVANDVPSFPALLLSDDYGIINGTLTTGPIPYPSPYAGSLRIMAGFPTQNVNNTYVIPFTRTGGMHAYAQVPFVSTQATLMRSNCLDGF